MLMQWGQFVDHDITHTPTVRGEEESGIKCCNAEGQPLPVKDQHRACLPIDIPANDQMFGKVGGQPSDLED
jgi:peroxidase